MDLVEQISSLAAKHGLTVACAESLTSGAIATELGKGEGASEWFAGGVVAYRPPVKFRVLDVDEGPVMTASCGEQMAVGLGRLFGSDACVAVTGVGGPGHEESEPPGTVFVATCVRDRVSVNRHQFEGDPPEVLDQTVHAALTQLAGELTRLEEPTAAEYQP